MKTLYVSDLDGTLLRSDQKTSAYTNRTINRLVEQGMLFSYATARSYNTAHKVTAGMTAAFPLIVYNGAFIKDNATGEMLLENFFDQPDATKLIRELIAAGIRPIVYGFVEGEEKFSYLADEINQPTRDFVLSRAGDSRDRPIPTDAAPGGGAASAANLATAGTGTGPTLASLLTGDIFYIVCIDMPDKLEPFNIKYKDRYHCVYQRDIYTGDQWLEIMPLEASKSRAIAQLKKLLDCDYLVVFGDAINDLDMFQIADEAYAVENACPELKEAATAIIAANDEDGVARWLESHIDID